MGGVGSGRQPYSMKRTTNDYLSIDIRVWAQEKLLVPGQKYGWQWSFRGKPIACLHVIAGHSEIKLYPLVVSNRQKKSDAYAVELTWTDCALGGRRPWFLCPLAGCNRRVAILYWGEELACRDCFNLVYASENENRSDRAARRAGWIRKKLKWAPGIFNPTGSRPKGMHLRTYHRLVHEYCHRVGFAFDSMSTQLTKVHTNRRPVRTGGIPRQCSVVIAKELSKPTRK